MATLRLLYAPTGIPGSRGGLSLRASEPHACRGACRGKRALQAASLEPQLGPRRRRGALMPGAAEDRCRRANVFGGFARGVLAVHGDGAAGGHYDWSAV